MATTQCGNTSGQLTESNYRFLKNQSSMQLNRGTFIDTVHNKQTVQSQCNHFCSNKLAGEINEQQELHIMEKCCPDAFGKMSTPVFTPSTPLQSVYRSYTKAILRCLKYVQQNVPEGKHYK